MIDAPLGDRTQWKPQWPELERVRGADRQGARSCAQGAQLTVVSYGRTLPLCAQAAEQLAAEGIDVEVIDLRTLFPYDWECIKASVEKTGRVLFVNEDTEVTNFGEHLLRRTVDELFYELLAPPRLLAGKHVPGHRPRRHARDGLGAAAGRHHRGDPEAGGRGAVSAEQRPTV